MRIPYRIRIRYGYARDTARIRIHAVSAYPSLIGPETHDWKRLRPLLDTACERGGRRGPPERGGGVDGRRRPDARRGRQAAAVEPEVDGPARRAPRWPAERATGRDGLLRADAHQEDATCHQHASTITRWRTPALR